MSALDFEKMVNGIKENFVVTADVNSNAFEVVNKYFPYWIGEEKGFTFENYIFSKTPGDGKVLEKKLIAYTDFDTVVGKWDKRNEHWLVDSITGGTYFEVLAKNEWTFGCHFPLEEATKTKYVIFDIEAELRMDNAEDNALLAATLEKDGKVIAFRAVNVKDFISPDSNVCKLMMSMDLLTLLGNEMDLKGISLKTFFWNKEFRHFYIKNFKVSLRGGNPYRYALYYDFHK